MAITIKDIAWLAGILEGEGHFGSTNSGNSPGIWVGMTDLDIIEKIRSIIDPSRSISISKDRRKETYKDMYRLNFSGQRAIGWMMTIYPLMSVRRKESIRKSTRKLKNMGFSGPQIDLAKLLKDRGKSEEVIISFLEKENVKNDIAS